jgi:hypothetical protein
LTKKQQQTKLILMCKNKSLKLRIRDREILDK